MEAEGPGPEPKGRPENPGARSLNHRGRSLLPRSLEDLDRGNRENFIEYWKRRPYHFQELFRTPFSRSSAALAFADILTTNLTRSPAESLWEREIETLAKGGETACTPQP